MLLSALSTSPIDDGGPHGNEWDVSKRYPAWLLHPGGGVQVPVADREGDSARLASSGSQPVQLARVMGLAAWGNSIES